MSDESNISNSSQPRHQLSVGLVHHPIVDKSGRIVATNVTNLDLHDIARACQVYAVERYFIITPMKEQQMFVSRVLDFWRTGAGSKYNHMRRTALTMVQPSNSIDDAVRVCGTDTEIIGTSARATEICQKLELNQVTFRGLREELHSAPKSRLILFGTGFGMAEEVFQRCHRVLEPISGRPPLDYRHLSVRSAVSICLDRLLGTW